MHEGNEYEEEENEQTCDVLYNHLSKQPYVALLCKLRGI